jgi:hypothetical protein
MLKYEFYSAGEKPKERPSSLHCFKYSDSLYSFVKWILVKSQKLPLRTLQRPFICSKRLIDRCQSCVDVCKQFVYIRQHNATERNRTQQKGKKSKKIALISQCNIFAGVVHV